MLSGVYAAHLRSRAQSGDFTARYRAFTGKYMKKLFLFLLTAAIVSLSAFAAACGRTFTVTFNGDGGTLVSGEEVQTVRSAAKIVEPVYEKTGYDFDHWNIALSEIVSDSTVTAVWRAKTFRLSFDPNGADVSLEVVKIKYDSEIPELPVPERVGFTFTGWKAESESGVYLDAGSVWKYDKDVTAVATWRDGAGYTVSYNLSGGTLTGDRVTFYKGGDVVDLTGIIPEREGYTFAGWALSDSDETITEISGKTGNITLVAKWTTNYFNLSFDTAGSADTFGTKQIAYGGLVPDLPVPGKDGYVFAGWKATNPDGKSIDAGTEWLYTEDITAVAVWQEGSGYSVSYDFAGGRFVGDKPTYVLGGSTVKLSSVIPVKDNFFFAGWQIRGGTGTVTELKNLQDNVVLEAVWTKEYYMVIFTDTPLNAKQSDKKVVLSDEYKSPIKVAYGGSLINRIPNGVPYNKEDYAFEKWVTYIDGKEIEINDRTVFDENTFAGLDGTEIIVYPVLKSLWIGPY